MGVPPTIPRFVLIVGPVPMAPLPKTPSRPPRVADALTDPRHVYRYVI